MQYDSLVNPWSLICEIYHWAVVTLKIFSLKNYPLYGISIVFKSILCAYCCFCRLFHVLLYNNEIVFGIVTYTHDTQPPYFMCIEEVEPQAHFLTKHASTDRELPQEQANTFLLYTLVLWLTFKLCIFDSKTHFISKLWVFWILKSHDWTLFRNTTYSVAQVLNCIANENDKRVLVKKETAIAIIVNIKSKIYKFYLVA